MPIRVGRHRRDRGRSVSRPTPLGNPFIIGTDGSRDEVLAKYRLWLQDELRKGGPARAQFEALATVAENEDVTILCWCAPKPCHADIIAEMIEMGCAVDRPGRPTA